MVVKLVTTIDYLTTLLVHGVSANGAEGLRKQVFIDKDNKVVNLDGVRHYLNRDYSVKPCVDPDSKNGVPKDWNEYMSDYTVQSTLQVAFLTYPAALLHGVNKDCFSTFGSKWFLSNGALNRIAVTKFASPLYFRTKSELTFEEFAKSAISGVNLCLTPTLVLKAGGVVDEAATYVLPKFKNGNELLCIPNTTNAGNISSKKTVTATKKTALKPAPGQTSPPPDPPVPRKHLPSPPGDQVLPVTPNSQDGDSSVGSPPKNTVSSKRKFHAESPPARRQPGRNAKNPNTNTPPKKAKHSSSDVTMSSANVQELLKAYSDCIDHELTGYTRAKLSKLDPWNQEASDYASDSD